MKNKFQLLFFLLISFSAFSQDEGRLSCRQVLFYATKNCEKEHDMKSFAALRQICDSIENCDSCPDCKSDPGFWVINAEANYDLSCERGLFDEVILKYCERSIHSGYKAISLSQKSFPWKEELPGIMRQTMEREEQIYFNERDSTNYWRSQMRMDTIKVYFIFPQDETTHPSTDTIHGKAIVYDNIKPIPVAPKINQSAASAFDGVTAKFTFCFYNDSTQTDSVVGPKDISITIIDTVSKEKIVGNWIYRMPEKDYEYYQIRLESYRIYSVKVEKKGCVTQNRLLKTTTDSYGTGGIFYLFKPGTPFYYEQNIQIPFHEYSKLIYLEWADGKNGKNNFDQWADSLGLIPLAKNSFFYQRKDGKLFDPANDSLMIILRSHPEKVEFVGSILKIYKTGNPRILGNNLRIQFTKNEKDFSPKEKKQLNKIIAEGHLKYLGGDEYAAPLGMGYELNQIIAELNELPFVQYAYPETYSKTRTL